MKPLSEFLTDREIYILENHPQKTYQAIGEELGITNTRVRQIKVDAERKIREEKRREQVEEAGQIPVSLTLLRKELWVLYRALKEYHYQMEHKYRYGLGAYCDKLEPDCRTTQTLLLELHKILNQDPTKSLTIISQNDDHILIEQQDNKL